MQAGYHERNRNFDNSLEDKEQMLHYETYDKANYVFNGISYVSHDDTFLLTGKMWDHFYKVKLDYHKYVQK